MQSIVFEVNQIIDDYITFKPNRIYDNKIKNEFSDLNLTNYENLHKNNYTIPFLKTQLKKYKLKITGNKNELINRLYYFLNSSKYIIKIQRLFRGSLVRKMIQLRGNGLKCREKCVNTEDFLTMDELKNISLLDFFSYQEDMLITFAMFYMIILGNNIRVIFTCRQITFFENKSLSKNPYMSEPIRVPPSPFAFSS
jgi:hypothetical protein